MAANQPHELLWRALIVAHDRCALLRHRTSHLLLAGFAGRGLIANTDVAIAHDGYPLLDCEREQRRTNGKGCTGCLLESGGPRLRFTTEYAALRPIQQTKIKNLD